MARSWPSSDGNPFPVSPVGGGGGRTTGLEMIQNGTFTTDTLWVKGTGWTIAAGVATATAATSNLSHFTGPIVPGKNYLVTFTVTSFTGGTVTAFVGGGAGGTARGSAATFVEIIKAGASSNAVAFAASGATLDIDNVSVREL